MSVCGGKDGKCSCIFTAVKGLPDVNRKKVGRGTFASVWKR